MERRARDSEASVRNTGELSQSRITSGTQCANGRLTYLDVLPKPFRTLSRLALHPVHSAQPTVRVLPAQSFWPLECLSISVLCSRKEEGQRGAT